MARIIALSGDVGFEITARDVRRELQAANGEPVEIHINSRGGVVFQGIEIFNLIRAYEGETTVLITGLAASMGSYIALAANKVIAYDNATFMIHNALALALGNHNDMRKVADRLEGMSNILAAAYSRKTGKPMSKIKALMDDETFMFGKEMLDAGFVDEIIEPSDGYGDDDKDAAIMQARASVEMCLDRVRGSEAANADFERAVAYMDTMGGMLAESLDAGSDMEISGTDYDAAVEFDPEAPYPNEHACRVKQPGGFQKDSFRRISRTSDGKTLDIIIGKLKGSTTTTTQAFRYPKDEWTVAQARKHCTDNKGLSFEPASGSNGAAQAAGCT